MVITKKNWSSGEVCINIDTKRMSNSLVQTRILIPSTEELCHELEGSYRFSALDYRDSFFHFALDGESQELFKFHRFLVLVMGTPPVSGECHTAMSRILDGLDGVIVLKDDILLHAKGEKKNDNLDACLQCLYDYGIRLRREKYKLGEWVVLWFGHIYSRQEMSPDLEKVEHQKTRGRSSPSSRQCSLWCITCGVKKVWHMRMSLPH